MATNSQDQCLPGVGYSQEFLVGVCCLVLQILILLQTKKCHFPHPFSDLASIFLTCFQTWRRSQNATQSCLQRQTLCHSCITEIRTPTKGFLKILFQFTYYSFSLIHMEWKRQEHSCITVVPQKLYPIPDQNTHRFGWHIPIWLV